MVVDYTRPLSGIPYSTLFSYGANFGIFRIEALHTKIKKIRNFENCTTCYMGMCEHTTKIKHTPIANWFVQKFALTKIPYSPDNCSHKGSKRKNVLTVAFYSSQRDNIIMSSMWYSIYYACDYFMLLWSPVMDPSYTNLAGVE